MIATHTSCQKKAMAKNVSQKDDDIQSTLGFATMGIAANLGIATATSLTVLCHYIIATLGITTYVAK